MNKEPTSVQRLAVSRARLADALRNPLWLLLLLRLLDDKSAVSKPPEPPQTGV